MRLCPEQRSRGHEDDGEARAGGRDPQPRGVSAREHFRLTDHPREQPRADPGEAAEHCGGGEIPEVERRTPGDRQERLRSVDGDEHEIAGRGSDERRTEHVPGEVVLVGHLEREDGARRRRLEDRGDAGSGSCDQQESAAPSREQPRKTSLQRVADSGSQIQRRTLEPHRCAAAERRDAGDHPGQERSERQLVVRIVVRVEIFVGGRRRRRATDEPQHDRGNAQSDESARARSPTAGGRSRREGHALTAVSKTATPRPVNAPTIAASRSASFERRASSRDCLAQPCTSTRRFQLLQSGAVTMSSRASKRCPEFLRRRRRMSRRRPRARRAASRRDGR